MSISAMSDTKRYDPRMGDESGDEGPSPTRHRPHRHVRLEEHPTLEEYIPKSPKQERTPSSTSSSESTKKADSTKATKSAGQWILDHSPVNLKWIPDNWNWSKIKPVIRSALVAWISLLFFVIRDLEKMLGQASFLILIAAFLMPPNDPFIAVLERELALLTFVTASWAWSCLGIFLANLARTNTDRNAPLTAIFSGQYVEAGPTVILAVFLFVGSTFFLYLKARFGPGPFLFATIFSCICMDISLGTTALFPYPFYNIGKAIVVPLSLHSALAVVSTMIIFPSTITAQYTTSVGRILDPLSTALAEHRKIFKMAPTSDEFAATANTLKGLVTKSEGGLSAAGVWLRLLARDVVWGRFAPSDIGALHWWVRRLVTRSEGMNIYFTLIDPTRERFPVTPAPTAPNTPATTAPNTPVAGMTPLPSAWTTPAPTRPPTPAPTRPSSPINDEEGEDTVIKRQSRDGAARRRNVGSHRPHSPSPLHNALTRQLQQSLTRSSTRHTHHHHHHHHKHASSHDSTLHYSLLQLAHSLALSRVMTTETANESAVGVFESQRYLALESTRLTHGSSPELTEQFTELLGESCDGLLGACEEGMASVRVWLSGVRRSSFGGKKQVERERKERLDKILDVRAELNRVIEHFRQETRHLVLDPYRCAFDSKHVGASGGAIDPPPHRYLFHCYMYQYHLLQLSLLISSLLDEIVRLEQERKKAKLWFPTLPIFVLFWWSKWNGSEDMDREDDEDPDIIQGIEPEMEADLGMASRRDPDALPPSNAFEFVMYWMHGLFAALAGGNAVFAIKAGLLTVILTLPYYIKGSAHFAYNQHFVWGIFMGQLTLARFRGDTTFGLVARIFSTFFGGIVGMIIWYISTGSGRGNPYGLAVITAVCFPFFFFVRLYWPGPPMTNLIFFVTSVLVIGFSWQDTHFPSGFPYFGWDVAWRRFVLVTGGVTAAFLASFLPPSNTLRGYQRRMMSTTVAEIGAVYCSIVSFANTQHIYELDRGTIIQSLIAIRLKLKRSLVLRTNIVYEFSLRGKWPAQRYQKILEIQLQTAYLLSHLMSVVEHLEPAWRRAFLRRTRFLDADFQGDVLAVISMISTSLRTGHPLPQITPCPLVDRYMQYTHGLNVIRQEADDDYGLPRTMTIDTLANEQYLCFSVGCTTAFGIVTRLDRLMVATKELVGEQYHIHGVGLPPQGGTSRPASVRPAKDV